MAKTLHTRGWATDELTLRGLLGNPAYRAVRRMARAGMNADYRDYLDRLMKDVQPSARRDVAQVWRAYVNEERGTELANVR